MPLWVFVLAVCSSTINYRSIAHACGAMAGRRTTICIVCSLQTCQRAPYSPSSSLCYGFPHLCKVLEALMCIVSDKVSQKRVSFKVGSETVTKTVSSFASCRHSTSADWTTLADHHCLLGADQSQGEGKVCARWPW